MIVNVSHCRVWKENASVSSEYSAGIVTGTFLASETEPQRLSHRPLGRCRTFFRLKSSTRLVVYSRVSPSDANRMSALLKVKNYASVSQQKVFWKNQTCPNLSWSEKLVMVIVTILAVQTVMAIVTLLAIKTVMAIMTALAIEIDMAIVTMLAIETDMAIVTMLAIKTDIHGYRDHPGHRNRHSWLS